MQFRQTIEESARLHAEILKNEEFLAQCERAGKMIGETLVARKKVLVGGNGGSAADAQHFAAEIVATFKKEKRSGYPVLALTTDTSFLTAWTNDFGYDEVFARQVQAFGGEGDVFLGITTSGNSRNILLAMEEAKRKGLKVVGLLGGDGGAAREKCDVAVIVPSSVTARVQEIHELVLHAWCEEIISNLK